MIIFLRRGQGGDTDTLRYEFNDSYECFFLAVSKAKVGSLFVGISLHA